jgi:hypothetical protein
MPDVSIPQQMVQPRQITVEDPHLGLPPAEEGKPAAQTVLLPVPQPHPVSEPEIPITLPGSDIALPSLRRDSSLVTEAVLGAGMENHIYSSLMLSKLGARPSFSLEFLHETFDGTFFTPRGPFFHRRTDALEGDLNLRFNNFGIDAMGHYNEQEMGLQDQSEFSSRIIRDIALSPELTATFADRFRLTGLPYFSMVSTLNRGSTPEQYTEYLGGGTLEGAFLFDTVKTGLTAEYSYRWFSTNLDKIITPPESPSGRFTYNLHRLGVYGFADWIQSQRFQVQAEAGWYYTFSGKHLFPFSVAGTVKPIPFLSFSLEGGYRVKQHNLADIISDYPLIRIPDTVTDNHGWYGAVDLTFQLWEGAQLMTGSELAWNSGYPYPGNFDEGRGFFDLRQEKTITFEPRARFDWDIAEYLSLHLLYDAVFPIEEIFIPVNTISLNLSAQTRTDKAGGTLETMVRTAPVRGVQLPFVGLSGFYRFTENIKVSAEVEDILSAFMKLRDIKRYIWEPYQDIGFRFTIKTQITF